MENPKLQKRKTQNKVKTQDRSRELYHKSSFPPQGKLGFHFRPCRSDGVKKGFSAQRKLGYLFRSCYSARPEMRFFAQRHPVSHTRSCHSAGLEMTLFAQRKLNLSLSLSFFSCYSEEFPSRLSTTSPLLSPQTNFGPPRLPRLSGSEVSLPRTVNPRLDFKSKGCSHSNNLIVLNSFLPFLFSINTKAVGTPMNTKATQLTGTTTTTTSADIAPDAIGVPSSSVIETPY